MSDLKEIPMLSRHEKIEMETSLLVLRRYLIGFALDTGFKINSIEILDDKYSISFSDGKLEYKDESEFVNFLEKARANLKSKRDEISQ